MLIMLVCQNDWRTDHEMVPHADLRWGRMPRRMFDHSWRVTGWVQKPEDLPEGGVIFPLAMNDPTSLGVPLEHLPSLQDLSLDDNGNELVRKYAWQVQSQCKEYWCCLPRPMWPAIERRVAAYCRQSKNLKVKTWTRSIAFNMQRMRELSKGDLANYTVTGENGLRKLLPTKSGKQRDWIIVLELDCGDILIRAGGSNSAWQRLRCVEIQMTGSSVQPEELDSSKLREVLKMYNQNAIDGEEDDTMLLEAAEEAAEEARNEMEELGDAGVAVRFLLPLRQ